MDKLLLIGGGVLVLVGALWALRDRLPKFPRPKLTELTAELTQDPNDHILWLTRFAVEQGNEKLANLMHQVFIEHNQVDGQYEEQPNG